MRHTRRAPTPADLTGPKSKGRIERADVELFYGTASNRTLPYPKDFTAYKLEGVKQALERTFGGKCAYCEGSYEGRHPVDVEHYRPKGGYIFTDGKLKSPGYYWLAAEWKNLLPSCIDCNRRRKHRIRGGEIRSAGKANLFPLVDERARATAPREERNEKPLLLNPCDDHPERHLVFDDQGYVDPKRGRGDRLDARGKASIEVYGLDRDGLVRSRQRVLKGMSVELSNFRRVVAILDDDPDNAAVADLLRDMKAQIEAHADPSQEYSEMARQVIETWKSELAR